MFKMVQTKQLNQRVLTTVFKKEIASLTIILTQGCRMDS